MSIIKGTTLQPIFLVFKKLKLWQNFRQGHFKTLALQQTVAGFMLDRVFSM